MTDAKAQTVVDEGGRVCTSCGRHEDKAGSSFCESGPDQGKLHSYRVSDKQDGPYTVPSGSLPVRVESPKQEQVHCATLREEGTDEVCLHCGLQARQWDAYNHPFCKIGPAVGKLHFFVPKQEQVHHPAHYGGDTPHEIIKCLAAWGLDKRDAYLWNAVKYIARAGIKTPDALQDLEKAKFYLDARITQLKGKARQ